MNRSGKRHRPTAFDALDVPLVSRKKPLLHNGAHFTKFSVKLRSLLDQEKYAEAKLLFTEMVKSSKYDFKNLWQAGIEVIGRSSPHELVGYLKAVFISAPPRLSAETFNVYIDQLLIESNWTEALDEMELRYHMPTYHHPIVLRKMALCAYHLWNKAYSELPEDYFEEEEYDRFDITHLRYQKYLRAATKYLAEAHHTYLRDSEIFEIYFSFLQKTKDVEGKKSITLQSLEAFKKDPEYYLLYALMKRNKNNRYFNNEDYIIPLYEFDPFLDEKVKQLRSFCKKTLRRLKALDEHADEEERTRINKLIVRIFRLFVTRIEHGNVEAWFCKVIVKMCTLAMCQEMEDVYFYYNVDELLRTTKSVSPNEKEDIIASAVQLKAIVSEFILQNNNENSLENNMERSLYITDERSEEEDSGLDVSVEAELGSPFLLVEQEAFYHGADTTERESEQSDDRSENTNDNEEDNTSNTSDDRSSNTDNNEEDDSSSNTKVKEEDDNSNTSDEENSSDDTSDASNSINEDEDDLHFAAIVKEEEIKKNLEDSVSDSENDVVNHSAQSEDTTPSPEDIIRIKKELVEPKLDTDIINHAKVEINEPHVEIDEPRVEMKSLKLEPEEKPIVKERLKRSSSQKKKKG